jgi:hypothetical protein
LNDAEAPAEEEIMKIAAVCLLWVVVLASPGVMAQQTNVPANTPNQSWDALRQTLSAGRVQVQRKDGKKFSGEALSLSDTELVIERKGKAESFKRDEVKKVWQVAPPSRRKRAIFGAIGGAAGFLVGVPIAVSLGFKQCGGSCADEGAGMLAALIGLPVAGVFAGRALAGRGKRTLLYSAP